MKKGVSSFETRNGDVKVVDKQLDGIFCSLERRKHQGVFDISYVFRVRLVDLFRGRHGDAGILVFSSPKVLL